MNINMMKNVLNNLNSAVVAFDKTGKLNVYNQYLITLWNIKDFNNLDNMSIVEFFEILRENQVYPQQDNFREFCHKVKQFLLQENFNLQQNLLLSNGKNIQEQIIKHDDMLLFIWNDTTDIWDVTYALNNHKNMYQRIIDKNPLPIIVVATTGQIENYNGKFLEAFSMNSDNLNTKPHIREILSICTFNDDDSSILLGNILSSRSFYHKSQNNYKIYGISMPNTHMFVMFSAELDMEPLDINQILLSNGILQLHNNLIFELNHLIGSPLNSIIGYGEMLKNQYVGNLNIKQLEYIDKILNQAQIINQDFTYKLELLELNQIDEIDLASVDINLSVAHILHQLRGVISHKAIDIKLTFPTNMEPVSTSQSLLVKIGVLLLGYLLEHNLFKSQMNIEVIQKNKLTQIIFSDSSTKPLFSKEDNTRYDILLLWQIVNKLNMKLDYAYKNKKHRVISLELG